MLLYTNPERPNRLVSPGSKNEQYHLDYSRWVFSNINQSFHQAFVWKSIINWAFYKGDQWMFSEDLDPFLMDESGDVRNRIRFVQNIIRPYVEYYTGSVIRMDMSATAVSVSGHAVDRREKALAKLMFYHAYLTGIPQYVAEHLREKMPIGETPEETVEMFQNLYKDQYVEDVNAIIEYLTDKNDMEEKKVPLARHIALDGLGVLFEEDKFGEQVWEVQDPRNFFFDRSAKRPDLKDAEFMGNWDLCSLADIAEKYPELPKWKLRILEQSSNMQSPYIAPHNLVSFEWSHSAGRIPRYRIFWRDIEYDTWGIAEDENGNPRLVNMDVEGIEEKQLIKNSELKKYVDENEWIDKVMGMKNKKKIACDIVRYCDFVPAECVQGGKDIILGYGVREYQNKYSYQYNYPDWPFKVYCWSYNKGEVLAPIDDLISPQRFINRLISTGESHINNFRGSGIIYDKDMIAGEEGGEEEFLRRMNLGMPIGVNGNGQLNNSVVPYGNDMGRGTLQLFEVAGTMKQMAESIIGGGESLMGQGGAYRASATVAQQNLQQGTTMQEPVFYAINKTILQAFESMANRGRRILTANKSRLNVVVGDMGMRTIALTKDYDLEQYRVKVVRSANPQQDRQAANEMLLMLLERQLINHDIFAEFYDKTTLAGIGKAIRKYSNFVIEQARAQQKAAAEQQQNEADAAMAEQELQGMEMDRQVALKEKELAAKQGKGQGEQGEQRAPLPQSNNDTDISYGKAKFLENMMQTRRNL